MLKYLQIVQKMLKLDKREAEMEELKLERTKKLKRQLGYAAKNAAKAGAHLVNSGTKKVLAFVVSLSLHGISADALGNYGNQGNGIEIGVTASDFKSSGMQVSTMETMGKSTAVLATFEECRQMFGDDVKLDISQIEFSMKDLELAQGKESDVAKKMLEMALRNKTASGRCTRNSKMTIRDMGWADGLSKEDRAYF